MHALPIELPLVASGEFNSPDGFFVLDKKLKEGKNYLVLIDNIYEDTLITTNIYLPKLNERARYAQSALFELNTPLGVRICFLRHEYDEADPYKYLSMYDLSYHYDNKKFESNLLIDFFEDPDVNSPVIYIYELSNEPSMIP